MGNVIFFSEKPNYVLKAEEGILMPKPDMRIFVAIRNLSWAASAVVLAFSFLPGWLHLNITWMERILIVLICIVLFLFRTDERQPSPFEIWFFDDCFVLFRNRRYYTKRVTLREYNVFPYRHVDRVQYDEEQNCMDIIGVAEGIWFRYNPDGTVSTIPSYHKVASNIFHFNTSFAKDIDFVKEIEQNSPLKVDIV